MFHIIIIILFIREFFTPALADGFLRSLNLQDSSSYSGRFQLCCILDGPHSSYNFQVLQSLYQSFCDCHERAN